MRTEHKIALQLNNAGAITTFYQPVSPDTMYLNTGDLWVRDEPMQGTVVRRWTGEKWQMVR